MFEVGEVTDAGRTHSEIERAANNLSSALQLHSMSLLAIFVQHNGAERTFDLIRPGAADNKARVQILRDLLKVAKAALKYWKRA